MKWEEVLDEKQKFTQRNGHPLHFKMGAEWGGVGARLGWDGAVWVVVRAVGIWGCSTPSGVKVGRKGQSENKGIIIFL